MVAAIALYIQVKKTGSNEGLEGDKNSKSHFGKYIFGVG